MRLHTENDCQLPIALNPIGRDRFGKQQVLGDPTSHSNELLGWRMSSVQLFFTSRKTRRDLRKVADTERIIIFGHSFGGDVSNRFFNEKCEPVSAPENVDPSAVSTQPTFFARFLCEQFSPVTVPTAGVVGIVTYEGYVSYMGEKVSKFLHTRTKITNGSETSFLLVFLNSKQGEQSNHCGRLE